MSLPKENNLETLLNFLTSSSLYSYPENLDELKKLVEEEGLDPDIIETNILNSIKKYQLEIEADLTKKEMSQGKDISRKAIEFVDALMKKTGFSFTRFIKEERLSFQNRNLESLNVEDMRSTLIQYYTLKFMDEEKERKE